MLVSCQMMAVVWHNVNIDKKTAAAMTAAYEVEIAMETMANGHAQETILKTGCPQSLTISSTTTG